MLGCQPLGAPCFSKWMAKTIAQGRAPAFGAGARPSSSRYTGVARTFVVDHRWQWRSCRESRRAWRRPLIVPQIWLQHLLAVIERNQRLRVHRATREPGGGVFLGAGDRADVVVHAGWAAALFDICWSVPCRCTIFSSRRPAPRWRRNCPRKLVRLRFQLRRQDYAPDAQAKPCRARSTGLAPIRAAPGYWTIGLNVSCQRSS